MPLMNLWGTLCTQTITISLHRAHKHVGDVNAASPRPHGKPPRWVPCPIADKPEIHTGATAAMAESWEAGTVCLTPALQTSLRFLWCLE